MKIINNTTVIKDKKVIMFVPSNLIERVYPIQNLCDLSLCSKYLNEENKLECEKLLNYGALEINIVFTNSTNETILII